MAEERGDRRRRTDSRTPSAGRPNALPDALHPGDRHDGQALLVDQAKQSVVAHSWDGIEWFDRRVVLQPRLDAPYENAATIAAQRLEKVAIVGEHSTRGSAPSTEPTRSAKRRVKTGSPGSTERPARTWRLRTFRARLGW